MLRPGLHTENQALWHKLLALGLRDWGTISSHAWASVSPLCELGAVAEVTISKGALWELLEEVGLGVAQSARSNGEVNVHVPHQVRLMLACTQARVCAHTVMRLLHGKGPLRGPFTPSPGSHRWRK